MKNQLGFNDNKLALIGIPLCSVMVLLLLFNDQIRAQDWTFIKVCIPVSVLYTTVYWLLFRQTYIWVKMRYPEFNQIGKRVFILFFAYFAIFFLVDLGLGYLLKTLLDNHQHPENPLMEFATTALLSLLFLTIYESIGFYQQLERTVAEKNKLERDFVHSQLESLRNQVNPHFLFNSLNTLVYLIPENPEKAVNFVRQLSKVYRYVLESREAKTIRLQEEIDFLNAFIFLQKERFGDNFKVRLLELETHFGEQIVPLTLQMLFENAIKHNIISTEKPLIIEVFIKNNALFVRNNLQRKNQVADSTGVGLENIRNRYKMLSGKTVEVIVSQEYFTVVIPLCIT